MKQDAKQVRNKILTAIMASVVSIGFITAATAARLSVDTNIVAPANAQTGATAATHMSTSGSANNDARWGSGVSRGLDRAAERKSSNGDERKSSAMLHKDKV